MAITPKFYGTIKNGEVEYRDKGMFRDYLTFNFVEGQDVEVVVRKKFKRRSQGGDYEEANINGYYWAVIVRMFAEEIGEIDPDVVHGWIQVKLGNFIEVRGERIPKKTSEMSGGEFAEMCSKARTLGSLELNLYIPEPHEAEWK